MHVLAYINFPELHNLIFLSQPHANFSLQLQLQPDIQSSSKKAEVTMASTFSNTSTLTNEPPTTTTTPSKSDQQQPFTFPPTYSFPPFFTPQPNRTTRLSQLSKWSSLIRSYCRHHRIYRLSIIDAVENTPLFHNAQIRKRLSLAEARAVVDWMVSEEGGKRAEWVGGAGGEGAGKGGRAVAWIWWKRPEEWAGVLEGWVSTVVFKLFLWVGWDSLLMLSR